MPRGEKGCCTLRAAAWAHLRMRCLKLKYSGGKCCRVNNGLASCIQ